MNKQEEITRRLSDGSIDTDYYIRRAHKLRALALNEYWARGTGWALKQVLALMRLLKHPSLRLKKAHRVKDATLHVADGGARINLWKGRLVRLEDGKGFRIRCYSGPLWITQERDRRDIILQSGDAFILDRPGLTLVHAFANAQFAVEDPQKAIVVFHPKKSHVRSKDRNVNYARA
ncbi:MAG: DUF2917 domain-containing protein [Burkholderiales bacterium]